MVSVIVPFYNAGAFLEAAIQSVLNQTYANWELILVNDGSTDNSGAVAERYADGKRIFLYAHTHGENKGVSISRSLGISKSKGTFVSFLDADDFYEPTKIEKQVQVFLAYPGLVLVHSSANCVNESQKQRNFFYEFKFDKINQPYRFSDVDFLNKNHICNSSVMVKAETLGKIGNAFPHLFQYEDWINWILISQHGSFLYLDETLCNYRYHDNSSTSYLFGNPMSFMYAKLEMLFIILQRVESNSIREKARVALDIQLNKIFSFYKSPGNPTEGLKRHTLPVLKIRGIVKRNWKSLKIRLKM